MNLKKYDICENRGIDLWDEALPLGNGKLGCLVYGTDELLLALDRVDLWDNTPCPATLEADFNYQTMVKLVKSGTEEDWKRYQALFDYTPTPYPTKITAGRMILRFADGLTPRYELPIRTGVARVSSKTSDVRAEIFMSATRFIGAARVWGDFELDIHIPEYVTHNDETDGVRKCDNPLLSPYGLAYPASEIVRDGDYTYYAQKTNSAFEYGIVALKKKKKTYSELYFTIVTNEDGESMIEQAKQTLLDAYRTGYRTLKKEHTEWWDAYWKKSSINVGDELIESVYYRSWYLFASCSRKGCYPMPLQGVWTADTDFLPPWRGDYHHDTNTQLSYQSYLKANRLPEGESFLDYLWNTAPAYEAYAKEFFGVDGWLIPSCSTVSGVAIAGWAMYSFSPTMSIWTAQSFDEYYLYTGDIDFLKSRAYPFLSNVEKAITALLEERDGKLYLPLSSSPEIHDNTRAAWLSPNSNFDLALLQYLYKTLRGYAKTLGDSAAEQKYAALEAKLDPIALRGGMIVMLDKKESLTESHRHFSHVMCLYPLHLINYDTPAHRTVYEQTIKELERYGTGRWVGFSFPMMAQIRAMAHQGNGAYENLRTFAHGFVGDNSFHRNGDFKQYGYSSLHYRPFTLESSFGYCDALHEMLLQDHQGFVELFPAIPDEWTKREIAFADLRSVGGILVSATARERRLLSVALKADTPRTVRIKNAFSHTPHATCNGIAVKVNEQDGFLTVTLPAGETVLE